LRRDRLTVAAFFFSLDKLTVAVDNHRSDA